MTDILRAHDLSRDVKNDTHTHLTVDEYKQREMKKAEIQKLNTHINELKKKNPAELTEEEITLIKNQNDFMRSEILNYRVPSRHSHGSSAQNSFPLKFSRRTNYSLLLPNLKNRAYRLLRKTVRCTFPTTHRKLPPLSPRLFVRIRLRVCGRKLRLKLTGSFIAPKILMTCSAS